MSCYSEAAAVWYQKQHRQNQALSKIGIKSKVRCTCKNSGGPAGLHLSQRGDGPQGVDEAHHSQRWLSESRREDVLVEAQSVATLSLQG